MKKILLTGLICVLATSVFAQVLNPVKWSYGAKKINNQEAYVFIKATIDKSWHIYSQQVPDGGPIKTTIKFTPDDSYSLLGNTLEPKPVSKYEKTFSMNVQYFELAVIFKQKIKLKTGQATVNGTVNFMVCNNQQCLPPDDVDFSIPVK